MNAITGEKPVLVIGVAQTAEALPPALRATGKFGYELRLKPPDLDDRAALFSMFLNTAKVRFQGDFKVIANSSKVSPALT